MDYFEERLQKAMGNFFLEWKGQVKFDLLVEVVDKDFLLKNLSDYCDTIESKMKKGVSGREAYNTTRNKKEPVPADLRVWLTELIDKASLDSSALSEIDVVLCNQIWSDEWDMKSLEHTLDAFLKSKKENQ